ncbi:peptidoglycan DD-metalloendopeptidase family protein [Cellulosimicrobium sp. PMB13]|uniref:peptidoglycan DD-metalloendopeptidase family protein n=1 Tax=Cellulosimicrobium sp. PMB13 TaxID=3120158 RepID=UPI003F4C4919
MTPTNSPARRGAARSPRRLLAAVLAAVVLVTGVVTGASADDIDDRRAAAERRQQEILGNREQLAAELEGTDAELQQAVLDLQEIEARLPVAQAELEAAEAEVERTQREAELLAQRLEDALAQEASIAQEIEQSATQVADARSSIAEMARSAYRGQGDVSSLGIVTGAESTEEFIEEYAASSTAARSQSRTLQELQEAEAVGRNREARLEAVRETITDLKAQADQNVVEAEAARKAAADRKAEVEQLIVEQQAKKATIEDRKAAALKQIEQNEKDQASLQSELKGIIAEQAERDRKIAEEAERRRQEEERRRQEQQNQGGGGGGGGGGSVAPAPPPPTSSGLSYPTAVPHITSSYGMRLHPTLGIWRLHAGTDFRAYCGTPIIASASGTVLFARRYGGLGNQVLVNHGIMGGQSVMTSYNHLSRFAVSSGQWVDKGSIVGYSGNTGTSSACHLHFEVYVDGNTVDPMSRL